MSLLASPSEFDPNRKGPLHSSDDTTLIETLIKCGATELERLLQLRTKGWEDEGLDRDFQKQRHLADNPSPSLELIWFDKMKRIFQEMDLGIYFIPTRGPLKFLDMGCCPGGFSSYIMDKNPESDGVGLSLPVEAGGHASLLSPNHLSRFKLHFADLTYYQLGPTNIPSERLTSLPSGVGSRVFDLVILDGHSLRTQVSKAAWDRDRLLISQLIIGLQAVKIGGTIVIKLSHPECAQTARLLYMLDSISLNLVAIKPTTMHSNRGTFYAFARSVGGGPEGWRLSGFLLGLKKLWVELTFGGENGIGRFMDDRDLDFLISTDDLVNHFVGRLLELGKGVWSVQVVALRAMFRKRGLRY